MVGFCCFALWSLSLPSSPLLLLLPQSSTLVDYNTRASDLGPLHAAARLDSCEDGSQRLISHSELSLHPVPSGLSSPLFICPPSSGTVIFFPMLSSMWNISSLTRDRTLALCTGSMAFSPLGCQGGLRTALSKPRLKDVVYTEYSTTSVSFPRRALPSLSGPPSSSFLPESPSISSLRFCPSP